MSSRRAEALRSILIASVLMGVYKRVAFVVKDIDDEKHVKNKFIHRMTPQMRQRVTYNQSLGRITVPEAEIHITFVRLSDLKQAGHLLSGAQFEAAQIDEVITPTFIEEGLEMALRLGPAPLLLK